MDKLELDKLFFARNKLDITTEKVWEVMDIWRWSDEPAGKIEELLNYLNEESIRVNRRILSLLAEEKKQKRKLK